MANPVSEAQIAYKKVLQEKLVRLGRNGSATWCAPQQLYAMQTLIDSHDAAAMPFSPLDYPVRSRKILVEDLRNYLRVTELIA